MTTPKTVVKSQAVQQPQQAPAQAAPAAQVPAANPQAKALADVRALFTKNKKEIENALPRHLNPDRMLRIIMTEVQRTPKLLECDQKSLFGAVIQASQLGLEPGSALGHGYLIPFFNSQRRVFEVQFMPGYRGFLDLARRSGAVTNIVSRAVYEGDTFEYEYGLDERIVHRPCDVPEERGDLTYVYAIGFLKDGGKQFEVMSRAEIEAVRSQSKSGTSGPWKTHFDEMARKTVVRRLFKYLPVSIEMQTAVGLDEQAEADLPQDNRAIIDVEATIEEGVQAAQEATERKIHKVKGVRVTDDVKRAQEAAQAPQQPAQEPREPGSDEDGIALTFDQQQYNGPVVTAATQ